MLPPRLCHCGRIVKHGLRCECQRKADRVRKARHDANRPSARQRGYSSEWEKARAEYLNHHPHCRICVEVGRMTPATVVDHITPHRGDKHLFGFAAIGNLSACAATTPRNNVSKGIVNEQYRCFHRTAE